MQPFFLQIFEKLTELLAPFNTLIIWYSLIAQNNDGGILLHSLMSKKTSKLNHPTRSSTATNCIRQ